MDGGTTGIWQLKTEFSSVGWPVLMWVGIQKRVTLTTGVRLFVSGLVG